MANHNARCASCRYNTPKTRGGVGRLCNGEAMRLHNRCPEWAIDQYIANCDIVGQVVPLNIIPAVVASNRLCTV